MPFSTPNGACSGRGAAPGVTGLADSTSNGCISGNNSTIISGSNATRNGAGGAGDSGGNGNSGGTNSGVITSGSNASNVVVVSTPELAVHQQWKHLLK